MTPLRQGLMVWHSIWGGASQRRFISWRRSSLVMMSIFLRVLMRRDRGALGPLMLVISIFLYTVAKVFCTYLFLLATVVLLSTSPWSSTTMTSQFFLSSVVALLIAFLMLDSQSPLGTIYPGNNGFGNTCGSSLTGPCL